MSVQSDIFMARQPIFTKNRRVKAYELLYRSCDSSSAGYIPDGDRATKAVITQALMDFGMDALTGGKYGFVNFTENLLLQKIPMLLDKKSFVIEVLEDVELDSDILNVLEELKKEKFILALDDYDGKPLTQRQLNCFDIIKLDFMQTTPALRKKIVPPLVKAGKHMLAEKVESNEEFMEAIDLGFEMFQGYYFSRPVLMKKKQRSLSEATVARLANILSNDDFSPVSLAHIVRSDVHLTYKLLQKIRTIEYYRSVSINNIEHALVHMGINGIRRWVSLILMEVHIGVRQEELIRTALVRGRFCELMANCDKKPELSDKAFLVGMLSMLDVPDENGVSPIDDLKLEPQIFDGLRGKDEYLCKWLKTAIEYESGKWENITGGLEDYAVSIYIQSVKYANQMLGVDYKLEEEKRRQDKYIQNILK